MLFRKLGYKLDTKGDTESLEGKPWVGAQRLLAWEKKLMQEVTIFLLSGHHASRTTWA
jgi:hypothetical protein